MLVFQILPTSSSASTDPSLTTGTLIFQLISLALALLPTSTQRDVRVLNGLFLEIGFSLIKGPAPMFYTEETGLDERLEDELT